MSRGVLDQEAYDAACRAAAAAEARGMRAVMTAIKRDDATGKRSFVFAHVSIKRQRGAPPAAPVAAASPARRGRGVAAREGPDQGSLL